jgi:hypothetical protein
VLLRRSRAGGGARSVRRPDRPRRPRPASGSGAVGRRLEAVAGHHQSKSIAATFSREPTASTHPGRRRNGVGAVRGSSRGSHSSKPTLKSRCSSRVSSYPKSLSSPSSLPTSLVRVALHPSLGRQHARPTSFTITVTGPLDGADRAAAFKPPWGLVGFMTALWSCHQRRATRVLASVASGARSTFGSRRVWLSAAPS